MSIKPRLLLIVLGLAALVLLAGVMLFREHHQNRMQDAFTLLSAGMERLNGADTAGALDRFHESVALFERLHRDPLPALHHLFAARLRSQALVLPEVRELAVPKLQDGEALLAIALSEDARLLGIATSRRLLCFLVEGERWAEWAHSAPGDAAVALHVDAATGLMHAISADDGRLVTAICRDPASALLSTNDAPAKQHDVAWFDTERRTVWVASVEPSGAKVSVMERALPGATAELVDMRFAFPGEPNTLFPRPAALHAISRIGDNVLLFYGDTELTQDADLRDESVLVTAIEAPDRQSNRLVFPAVAEEEDGGKVLWRSTHVRRVLPASAPGRVYALTAGPPGVAVLGSNAKPIVVFADSLYSTECPDASEIYDLSVRNTGGTPFMQVRRRGHGAWLSYELPWRFEQQPDLAVISEEGRRMVLASAAGGILLIDLSSLSEH